MGEKGVLLKYGIQRPQVWRKIRNVLSVKDNAASVRCGKSAQYAQGSGLAAAAGAKERDKFILMDGQIQFV